MAVTAKRRGGRAASAHERRASETDAQFAQRMILQERDRVRHMGGPGVASLREVVADLQALRDELRPLVQPLRELVANGLRAKSAVGVASSTDPTEAWALAAAARHRAQQPRATAEPADCACVGVCQGPVAGWSCALQTDAPRGWAIRARSVFRALAHEPDAGEEQSIEFNWEIAQRYYGRAEEPIDPGKTYSYDNARALSWFATALAAFVQAHPDGTAMQWQKQLHSQLSLSPRRWDHEQLCFSTKGDES